MFDAVDNHSVVHPLVDTVGWVDTPYDSSPTIVAVVVESIVANEDIVVEDPSLDSMLIGMTHLITGDAWRWSPVMVCLSDFLHWC